MKNYCLHRGISVLLAVVMISTMIPATVFAEGNVQANEFQQVDAGIGTEEQTEAGSSAGEETIAEEVKAVPEEEPTDVPEAILEEEPTDVPEAVSEEDSANVPDAVSEEEPEKAAPEEGTTEAAGAAPEEEIRAEYASGTLNYEGSDYSVSATFTEEAGFPEGVTMTAKEITWDNDSYDYYFEQTEKTIQEQSIDQLISFVKFYDITFTDENGEEVQPTGSVNIRISYEDAQEKKEEESVKAVHFADDGIDVLEVNALGSETSVEGVEFSAEGFSVYAIVDTENADLKVVAYEFYGEDGTLLSRQMVKNYDVLLEPEVPVKDDESIFLGWYEENSGEAFDGFGEVRGITEEKTVRLNAVYNSDTVHIIYHDLDGNVIYSDLAGVDSTITICQDQPKIETNNLELFHVGWALTEGGAENVAGEYQVGNADVNLYPIVSEGIWVTFESGGGSPVLKQFIASNAMEDARKARRPEEPYRKGYTFEDWYADENLTELFDFNSEINASTSVYAKWKPGTDTEYQVRYWLEYQTDAETDAWDYKMYAREARRGTTGEKASYDVNKIFEYPYNRRTSQYELNASKTEEKTISADGKTIVDVYYNCKEYNISFSFPDSEGKTIKIECGKMKYSASLSKVWDKIMSYETDSYQIFDGEHRFTYSDASGNLHIVDFQASYAYVGDYEAHWARVQKAPNNLTHSIYLETLEGTPPDGKEGVKNTSARVQAGTVTDDKVYYLSSQKTFTAYSHATVYVGNYTGFTVDWMRSDGNVGFKKEEDGKTYFIFHPYLTSPFYGIGNEKGEFLYDYHNGEATCPICQMSKEEAEKAGYYIDTDGSLDIYLSRNKYNLIFHENGGKELEDCEIYYQKNLESYEPSDYIAGKTEITNPAGQKFIFGGWYTDNAFTDEFSFDVTMPAHDIDLYARWTPITYTVTFDSNGGSDVSPIHDVKYGGV